MIRLALSVLLLSCKPAPAPASPTSPARSSFQHQFQERDGRRYLTSPSGWQTVQASDGGHTGLYYDAATDVLADAGVLRSIALLGLGGGEMLRQARYAQPNAILTGVEIDKHTIALALKHFMLPPSVNIIEGNATAWIMTQEPDSLDVVMVDLFVDSEMVPESTQQRFFIDCERALRSGGIFIMNVYPDEYLMLIEDRMRVVGLAVERRRYSPNWVVVGRKP